MRSIDKKIIIIGMDEVRKILSDKLKFPDTAEMKLRSQFHTEQEYSICNEIEISYITSECKYPDFK